MNRRNLLLGARDLLAAIGDTSDKTSHFASESRFIALYGIAETRKLIAEALEAGNDARRAQDG